MTAGSRAARTRPAGTADTDVLARLEAAAFDAPWSADAITTTIAEPSSRAWLATEGGAPAGWALFRLAGDEAELLRIATAPLRRRNGIGHALLAAGLAGLDASGDRVCHLEVRADNRAALALYRAHGFAIVGRRPAYFRDGSDAVLMARAPPGPPCQAVGPGVC